MQNEHLDKAEIRSLRDIEDIKRLKHDYCYYGDWWNGAVVDVDRFAALFTDDALWDIGSGRCIGRSAIAEHLRTLKFPLLYGVHYAINPRIDVSGDQATGTWHLLGPLLTEQHDQPFWQCGVYYETYERTASGWRFKEVQIKFAFRSMQVGGD